MISDKLKEKLAQVQKRCTTGLVSVDDLEKILLGENYQDPIKQLIKAKDRKGLKIIVDLNYGHTANSYSSHGAKPQTTKVELTYLLSGRTKITNIYRSDKYTKQSVIITDKTVKPILDLAYICRAHYSSFVY